MFQTPPITKNLIIINALMFFAAMVGLRWGIDLNDVLGLHFFLAPDFHLYQLLTYMFMHANWEHIFFNLFMFWMFGRTMESVWGPRRFLIFYLVCGLGAGVIQEVGGVDVVEAHLVLRNVDDTCIDELGLSVRDVHDAIKVGVLPIQHEERAALGGDRLAFYKTAQTLKVHDQVVKAVARKRRILEDDLVVGIHRRLLE